MPIPSNPVGGGLGQARRRRRGVAGRGSKVGRRAARRRIDHALRRRRRRGVEVERGGRMDRGGGRRGGGGGGGVVTLALRLPVAVTRDGPGWAGGGVVVAAGSLSGVPRGPMSVFDRREPVSWLLLQSTLLGGPVLAVLEDQRGQHFLLGRPCGGGGGGMLFALGGTVVWKSIGKAFHAFW